MSTRQAPRPSPGHRKAKKEKTEPKKNTIQIKSRERKGEPEQPIDFFFWRPPEDRNTLAAPVFGRRRRETDRLLLSSGTRAPSRRISCRPSVLKSYGISAESITVRQLRRALKEKETKRKRGANISLFFASTGRGLKICGPIFGAR